MAAATPARVKRYRCHFTACVCCELCAMHWQSDRGSIRLTLNDYFAKICHAGANDGKLEALLLLLLPPSLLLLLLCALSRSSHHPIEAKSLYYFYCVPEKWRRENPLESLLCRSVCVGSCLPNCVSWTNILNVLVRTSNSLYSVPPFAFTHFRERTRYNWFTENYGVRSNLTLLCLHRERVRCCIRGIIAWTPSAIVRMKFRTFVSLDHARHQPQIETPHDDIILINAKR